jgi:hypothetical protein
MALYGQALSGQESGIEYGTKYALDSEHEENGKGKRSDRISGIECDEGEGERGRGVIRIISVNDASKCFSPLIR